MSDDGTAAETPPTTTDEIRAEIAETRAELAETVDQLTEKLDVKAQAGRKADQAKHAVAERAQHLKDSAPAPVANTVDAVGERVGPVAHRVNAAAAPHRKQILLGAAASVVTFLVVRRVRRRRNAA